MAAARVYVGVHHPLDVVAGLLLGAVVAGLGWVVLGKPLVLTVSRLRQVSPV